MRQRVSAVGNSCVGEDGDDFEVASTQGTFPNWNKAFSSPEPPGLLAGEAWARGLRPKGGSGDENENKKEISIEWARSEPWVFWGVTN